MNHRVIVLNHFASPRGGPGGTRHVELFGRLEGWDATVIAARRNLFTTEEIDARGELTGVWTTPYSGNGVSRIVNWASFGVTGFLAGLRGPRPAVIVGSSPHLIAPLAAWALSRVRRAPFVLEVRDLWPRVLIEMGQLTRRSPIYVVLEALERFLYRQADLVITLATGVRETLVAEGLDPATTVVISNGADPEDFEPSASRADLRRRFGWDGVVAIYAGAHGPANGLDLLLDAAADLQASGSDVHIVLVGDGALKEHLAERVATEGLRNVEMLDPVAKVDVPDLLAAADIGVHVLADVPLFKYGVSPNKLFDYLAAGLCTISNAGGDVGAMIDEARAGSGVSPTGLADGLRALADAGEEGRARMGDSGRRFMLAGYTRKVLGRRLASHLAAVVADRDGRPGQE